MGPKTALELSGEVGCPHKQVAEHLQHLAKSLRREGAALGVLPARCHGCDHVFDDRGRLTRPSRCPACRSERIDPPRFFLETA